jgi:hypothetical protein
LLLLLLFVVVVVVVFVVDVPFSEKGTRVPSSAKKHPIWHFCCSRELIFAELGKTAPFSEKGAVITGATKVKSNKETSTKETGKQKSKRGVNRTVTN